jgi:hypothetical protein
MPRLETIRHTLPPDPAATVELELPAVVEAPDVDWLELPHAARIRARAVATAAVAARGERRSALGRGGCASLIDGAFLRVDADVMISQTAREERLSAC